MIKQHASKTFRDRTPWPPKRTDLRAQPMRLSAYGDQDLALASSGKINQENLQCSTHPTMQADRL